MTCFIKHEFDKSFDYHVKLMCVQFSVILMTCRTHLASGRLIKCFIYEIFKVNKNISFDFLQWLPRRNKKQQNIIFNHQKWQNFSLKRILFPFSTKYSPLEFTAIIKFSLWEFVRVFCVMATKSIWRWQKERESRYKKYVNFRKQRNLLRWRVYCSWCLF